MRISIFLAWYDFWIGFFYDQKKRILYICPLPCVVIKVEYKKEGSEEKNKWEIDLSTGRPIGEGKGKLPAEIKREAHATILKLASRKRKRGHERKVTTGAYI